MPNTLRNFTGAELDEVFPRPAVREVAFEIRFAPRFRVNAELWKLQDQLVDQYPEASVEPVMFQPSGPILNVNVFQNQSTGKVIKVSQENFVIASTRYTCFEDFKDEVVKRTEDFRAAFGLTMVSRVGLRYVNNVPLPPGSLSTSLLRFVRPFVDFDRVGIDTVEQFVSEIRARHNEHEVTIRGALLPPLDDGRRMYILDIDCHSAGPQSADRIPHLLDVFHETAQRFFLDHITEELKGVMRRKG